jgi:hypothetical protein
LATLGFAERNSRIARLFVDLLFRSRSISPTRGR